MLIVGVHLGLNASIAFLQVENLLRLVARIRKHLVELPLVLLNGLKVFYEEPINLPHRHCVADHFSILVQHFRVFFGVNSEDLPSLERISSPGSAAGGL